jgi:PPOX class probable F420-dependent enzyme
MDEHRKAESSPMMLSARQYAFVERRRIGRLATADAAAMPQIVPICFAIHEKTLYTALDEKPKRTRDTKRLRNIRENPQVTFLADYYDEDWSRLGWVMLRGRAEILDRGDEFEYGCMLLRKRYGQYASMSLVPVIAVRISQVRSWGNLDG